VEVLAVVEVVLADDAVVHRQTRPILPVVEQLERVPEP